MICIYVCVALHLSCYLQSSSEPDSWRWPTHDHVIQVCWTGTDKARYVYIYVYIYIRTAMRMLYYQTYSIQEITNMYYTFPHVSYHRAMSNKLSHTVQQKISGKGGQLWKRGPGEKLLGLCALERRFVRSLPRGGCERRAQRATWPRWAPLSAGVSQKPTMGHIYIIPNRWFLDNLSDAAATNRLKMSSSYPSKICFFICQLHVLYKII